MSAPVFGWPNYGDAGLLYTPTRSGGSWETTLPIRNVGDRRLAKVARSTDAATTSTTWDTNLGAVRSVRLLALLLPNLSSAGQVRVRGSLTADDYATPEFTSDWITPYPSGESAETLGWIRPLFHYVLPSAVPARYLRWEIDDPDNPDGYLDVAREFACGGWQPSRSLLYGARLGLETGTERSFTDGDSALYHVRRPRRTWDFDLGLLPASEARESGLRMQRLAGIDQQILFIADPDDDPMPALERSFVGVLRQVTALESVAPGYDSLPFQLLEEL